MAIFGKKPDSPERPSRGEPTPEGRRSDRGQPGPSTNTKAASFLGPGCELEGEFRGKGSFECRGRFKGDVEVRGDVIIGPEGRAEARLSARRIVIDGRLDGDAIGVEKVEVGATGHVEGDVRAPAVMFQEGAFFEGNVEMHRGPGGDDAAGTAGDSADGDGAGAGDRSEDRADAGPANPGSGPVGEARPVGGREGKTAGN